MTTEEKAKAYDEALERAKRKHGKFSEFVTKTIEEIFPELHKNDDERMRELIIDRVRSAEEMTEGLRELLLTYLENQKEQKPTERNEEVFDKIDKSFRKGREVGFQEGVESVKPAEWSDDDEQYLLICKNALNKYQRSDQWDANIISNWLEKRLKSSLRLQPKQEWSEEEEETIIEGACSALEIYGHTKLASRLKSLRPQPKQELSKKDKKILQSLHSVMNCADAQNAVKRNGLSIADVCNFLFSIEPYWKPSEEQMKALQSARFLYRDGLENSATASALESLYLDLKKL